MEVELEVVYERWMDLGGQWARGGDIGGGSKEGGGVMWGLFKSHFEKKKMNIELGGRELQQNFCLD